MAALQSIRKHNKLLVGLIGLALFIFIIELFLNNGQQNHQPKDVGSIYGNSLSILDYERMVDEYVEFYKFAQGVNDIDENTRTQIRNFVWNTYLTNAVIERECKKFGLGVSDEEIQKAYDEWGTQNISYFARQAYQLTGMEYRQLISELQQVKGQGQFDGILTAWSFVEHNVRYEILQRKYTSLLRNAIIANDIEGKLNFDAKNTQYEVAVAGIPYSKIDDASVELSKEDLQKKYEELKSNFYRPFESHTAQMIRVDVKPSVADRQALQEEMTQLAAELETTENIAKTVREGSSKINYYGFLCTYEGLPAGVNSRVKELEVGQVVGPFDTRSDNSKNVVRLVGKENLPDSVEVAAILVRNEAQADSVIACNKNGEPFDTLMAHVGGDSRWIVSKNIALQNIGNKEMAKFYNNFMHLERGSVTTYKDNEGMLFHYQGNPIRGTYVIYVKDRRNFVDKYDVAVVKRDIEFSRETYDEELNRLSLFMAENQKADDMRQNAAKKGYVITDIEVTPNDRNLPNIANSHAPLHWLFNEAQNEEISNLNECGNNDVLVVLIHKDKYQAGYLPINHPTVDQAVRAEALKDKKAAQLKQQMDGKSLAAIAAMDGAVLDTVKHVSPARGGFNISAMRNANEPMLASAVAGKNVNDVVSAVAGNLGVYTVSVVAKNELNQTYNADDERNMAARAHSSVMEAIFGKLIEKAEVVDNRYMFIRAN